MKSGKPFQSVLEPYAAEIKELVQSGMSVRALAAEIKARHDISISHNSIASFIRTHSLRRRSFLDGVRPEHRAELLGAIRAQWTHDSTAIEGNTLSLGDTMILLKYGLTVNGKPLKDHQDVINHANGVDLVLRLTEKDAIDEQDLFDLHKLVMASADFDIYKPIGAWKREDNGTYGVVNGKSVYMAYAPADETPKLMREWLKRFNCYLSRPLSEQDALDAYIKSHLEFVRIHPFFDGNGRMARLLANLPVLRAGYPPIVVPMERRSEYIRALWDYQHTGDSGFLASFRKLLADSWQLTLRLVHEREN